MRKGPKTSAMSQCQAAAKFVTCFKAASGHTDAPCIDRNQGGTGPWRAPTAVLLRRKLSRPISGSSIDRAPYVVRNAIALTRQTARKSAIRASCHQLQRCGSLGTCRRRLK